MRTKRVVSFSSFRSALLAANTKIAIAENALEVAKSAAGIVDAQHALAQARGLQMDILDHGLRYSVR